VRCDCGDDVCDAYFTVDRCDLAGQVQPTPDLDGTGKRQMLTSATARPFDSISLDAHRYAPSKKYRMPTRRLSRSSLSISSGCHCMIETIMIYFGASKCSGSI